MLSVGRSYLSNKKNAPWLAYAIYKAGELGKEGTAWTGALHLGLPKPSIFSMRLTIKTVFLDRSCGGMLSEQIYKKIWALPKRAFSVCVAFKNDFLDRSSGGMLSEQICRKIRALPKRSFSTCVFASKNDFLTDPVAGGFPSKFTIKT